jgi:hypothetical protein
VVAKLGADVVEPDPVGTFPNALLNHLLDFGFPEFSGRYELHATFQLGQFGNRPLGGLEVARLTGTWFADDDRQVKLLR